MKRSPMKPGTKPMARSGFKPFSKKPDSGKPRQKRMKSHGKIPPTAEESRWMDAVAELGCIVCLKFHQVRTPCAVHHILSGGRRKGHLFTIGLCDPGHHQNSPTTQKISRHPNKMRFEQAYGTEDELLEYTKQILERTKNEN